MFAAKLTHFFNEALFWNVWEISTAQTVQLFLDTPFLLQAVAVTQLYTVFMVISFLIFRQFFSKVQKMKELWLLIVTLTSLLATGSTMKKNGK